MREVTEIAEDLLTVAKQEIKSHLNEIGGYADKLMAELDQHPIKSAHGRIEVQAIVLKTKSEPYHIATIRHSHLAKMGIQVCIPVLTEHRFRC